MRASCCHADPSERLDQEVPFGGLMAIGVVNGVTMTGLTIGTGGHLCCATGA
jgi:hypothetical protein